MTDHSFDAADESEQLIPCPFCGGRANVYVNEVDFVTKWSVGCGDCNCNMDVCEDTPADAAVEWNTRVPDAAQPTPEHELARHKRIEVAKDAILRCPSFADIMSPPSLCAGDMAEAVVDALAAQPPAAPVETRKTFTIPPGYEAVRDSEGRATGEVRPQAHNGSSADNADEIASVVGRLRNFAIWNARHSHYDAVPLCKEAADLIERLTAVPQTFLWCCHARGPDDVYAAPDYITALAWSDALNEVNWSKSSKLNIPDPASWDECMVRATPAPWPHSPEAHAADLPKSMEGFSDPSTLSRPHRSTQGE